MRTWSTTDLKKARKLHRRRVFAGLRVSVESQCGSFRHWHDPHAGTRGKTRMLHDYGYIRGSLGTDGGHVDVYLGPNEKAENVYIVDQAKKPAGSHPGDGMPWSSFDEQKVMMGFDDIEAARRAYLAHYNDPRFMLSIRSMPLGEFRAKVTSKHHHGYVIKSLRKSGPHKYISRKPDGKGGWEYTYPDDHVGPRAHSVRMSGAIFGGEDRDTEVYVTHLADGNVRVSSNDAGHGGAVMPAESLTHFRNDLAGRVDLPASKNDDVNAVIDGKAKLLGKGDDGIAFKVGDKVVKVSTTVPYQPFNPGHRTPEGAATMLREQAELGNKLADAGVPGLQRSTFVEHEGKGFQIKQYVAIPEKLTSDQLDSAHATVLALHEKGYSLNDTVQVGVEPGGRVVLFDIGKVAKATGDGPHDTRKVDLESLGHLYKQHGHEVPAALRKPNPMHRMFWGGARSAAKKLLAGGDKAGAIERLVAERESIRADKKVTAAELGDLADWEIETEDALGIELPAWTEAKKSMPRFTLRKGSHKYIERHPDGKGGWDYTYAEKRGPHADAHAHLTPAARKPGAKACGQCSGRGKVVSRQPGLFGGADQITSATCRRCKGHGAER